MTRTHEDIRTDIEKLAATGQKILDAEMAYWIEWDQDDPPERKIDFAGSYHRWYSRALRAVRQPLPERADEFELYYRDPKAKMTLSSFTIQDLIAGVVRSTHSRDQWAFQALGKFRSQIAIFKPSSST